MIANKKKFVLPFLCLLIVAILYSPVFRGFFQQDEWLAFNRHILLEGAGLFPFLANIFSPKIAHLTPLNVLVINFLYSVFRLNYLPYALVSVGLHLLTVVLVFRLASLIFKDQKYGLIVGSLFGLMAAGFQATAWVLADTSVHWSTIFGLLSLISFFLFLEKEKNELFFWSLIFLFVSLLFKEVTVGLFFLLPLAFFLFSGKGLARKKKYPIITLTFAALYIFLRAAIFFQPALKSENLAMYQSTSRIKQVYNFATLPLKSVSQTFLPSGQLRVLAELAANLYPDILKPPPDTPDYEVFILERVMEASHYFILLVFAFIVFSVWRRQGKDRLKKIQVFGLLWIIVNSFIFVLSPERQGIIFLIDSRNLYFISIGTAILMTSLITSIVKKDIKKVFALAIPILLLNVFWLNKELSQVSKAGHVRKRILEKIKNEHPDLPEKVIFYTESDSSFYGLPASERILPFQSGLGQTLLVWYKDTGQLPKEFFQDRFLWEISEQGYKEVGGRGFGYFRDFALLAHKLEENNLDTSSIIAYRYDSVARGVEDMSDGIRGRLAGLAASKQKVDSRGFQVTASEEPETAYLAVDGFRETAWDSRLVYRYYQYFQIDFVQPKKIAKIVLNSYNNQNQDQVGYSILLSDDGDGWKEVFYAKRYPPDENGLIEIYFQPESARYLRIQQQGFHEYASWVIHELEIFESISK